MAVSYKELGLVNTKELFKKAIEGKTLSLRSTSITWSKCRQL
jgi:hypothetical protein